jgi:hypothetical protein
MTTATSLACTILAGGKVQNGQSLAVGVDMGDQAQLRGESGSNPDKPK